MATLLRMPEVAANATSAVLQAWTKKEGDAVVTGDCLAEIETEKAVVELNADTDGIMGRTMVQAGQDVPVGAAIGVLLAAGEAEADIEALIAAPGNIATPPAAVQLASTTAPPEQAPVPAPQRVFASPLARRLAAQRGLDIGTVKGSGPNGRVVKRDLDAVPMPPASIATSARTASMPIALYTDVPHTSMRRTIARRLTESKTTIPHFYLAVDCRMDRLAALRAEINAGSAQRISVNDFVIRATALALRELPAANVSWTDAGMRQYDQADIAVAVSTDAGLITPIVRAAERKSISMISSEIVELAARARTSQLRPEEYQGGGFSVSNLGMFGVTEFSAIINPPQAAILAVGATQSMPVADGGCVVVASVMRCTLSVDHRAIDGALAAQWLGAFKRLIESPLSLLI